mmetsp:Transcript_15030/g.35438  ORF Transcript_15030/g.35438 Transcript_15030/m.35438 type:complete len:303 (+) Transcript_15030:308-1216(+)
MSLSSSKSATHSSSVKPHFSFRYLTVLPLPATFGKKSYMPRFIACPIPSSSSFATSFTVAEIRSTASGVLQRTRKQPVYPRASGSKSSAFISRYSSQRVPCLCTAGSSVSNGPVTCSKGLAHSLSSTHSDCTGGSDADSGGYHILVPVSQATASTKGSSGILSIIVVDRAPVMMTNFTPLLRSFPMSSTVRSETVPAPMVDVGSNRHFRSSPSLLRTMAVESAAFGIVVTPFFTVSFSKWQSVPSRSEKMHRTGPVFTAGSERKAGGASGVATEADMTETTRTRLQRRRKCMQSRGLLCTEV